jgi:hypothetical protein
LSAKRHFNNCAKLYLVVFHAISVPAFRRWIRLAELHDAFRENLFALRRHASKPARRTIGFALHGMCNGSYFCAESAAGGAASADDYA